MIWPEQDVDTTFSSGLSSKSEGEIPMKFYKTVAASLLSVVLMGSGFAQSNVDQTRETQQQLKQQHKADKAQAKADKAERKAMKTKQQKKADKAQDKANREAAKAAGLQQQ